MIWSSNLAYVVGLIATDGCLSNDGRHIDLTSKDLEQIQNFENILKTGNKIGRKRSSFNSKKSYYRLQFANIKFYTFLVSTGLTPNKSKTLGKLKIPDQYFSDFLRGCFDGDGCTYSLWDTRWKNSFRFYSVLVSASPDFLHWVRKKVSDLYSIEGSIDDSKTSILQLVYAKKASVALVKKLYYSDRITCLSRKKFKIQAALDIISQQQAGVGKLVDPLP